MSTMPPAHKVTLIAQLVHGDQHMHMAACVVDTGMYDTDRVC